MESQQPSSTFDLIVRQVHFGDHSLRFDIGCQQGKITAIEPHIGSKGIQEINGSNCFACPPVIDPHCHLDKSFLQPVPNISGTLGEAIRLMSSHKQLILTKDFEGRVERSLRMALTHGTTTLRTHVDLDPINGTKPVEKMAAIRERWRGLVDIQIVAFPQEGLFRIPENQRLLRQAMQNGATVVGGIPSIEENGQDQQAHIEFVLDLASEFSGMVDLHVDETDDPASRTLEMLARTALQTGFSGNISAAHCCSLAAQDDRYAMEVIDIVRQADIQIITNPTANLILQGRQDSQPVRRGITRVKELLTAGVNVCCGHDNLRDPFYPFGQADMLEVAFVTALTAHLSGVDEIRTAFDMIGIRAAACLGLTDYGIRVGGAADLLLLPGDSLAEILAERPAARTIIRDGKVICRTEVNTVLHPATFTQ